MDRHLSLKAFALSHLLLLILAASFLFGFYKLVNQGIIDKSLLENYLPVTQKPASFYLELSNPEDNLLTFDKSVILSGKTSAHAIVIISSQSFDLGFEANSKGEFSKVLNLEEGLNQVQVSAFDNEGNTKTLVKTIYYSKEEL